MNSVNGNLKYWNDTQYTVDSGLYMKYITNSAMDHSSKGPKIKTYVLRLIGLNYANHIPAHCISWVFPEH